MRNPVTGSAQSLSLTLLAAAIAVVMSAAPAPASGVAVDAATPEAAPPRNLATADEVEPAWFAFLPITLYVDLPAGDPNGPPPPPDPALPDAEVFLIAPIDPLYPQDPGVVIPSPPAPFPIVVPVHDTVLTQPRTEADRANCFGVQVLPGPKASTASVLTRADPNGGATLAFAIRILGITLPLNNAAVIRAGATLGLLSLDRSWPGYGGTCWTGRPGSWPAA